MITDLTFHLSIIHDKLKKVFNYKGVLTLKKKSILNFYFFIAIVNFVCCLLLLFSKGVSTVLKITSLLFFLNFILNLVLATKRSKGNI